MDDIVIGAEGNVWIAHDPRGVYRVLTGVVPSRTAVPVVTGRVASGTTLSATTGSWRYLPSGYAYTWRRCSGTNANARSDMPGASGATYAIQATDIERGGVRVLVSATNPNGASAGVASNIVTGDSPPSSTFRLGASTRKKYVITMRLTAPGPGTIAQAGTVPGKSRPAKGARKATAKPQPVKACAPKPVVVALGTGFTPTGLGAQ
ncbi:MAG: hypothetical protein FJW92_04085 [Actinobacteria bacterium]|nr:hypothetical protein [Actinomycetota bacterium]